ncbi:MAG TPA: arginase family protein [Puia sp.]|nr:arginase family protein [Puia sp.]
MQHLHVYRKQDIIGLTRIRQFETKVGERVSVAADAANVAASVEKTDAEYILIGIPEDIGVRANEGRGGTGSAWPFFLKSFLNLQSNDFLTGEGVLVLGYFDFSELDRLIEANAYGTEEKTTAYRHAVHSIDEAVEPLIKLITAAGKIPVVIGGGHNNAYPLIKGAAKGLHKAGLISLTQINAVNLDAHSGFGPIEGRHSGNSFRYAEEDGFLEKYCAIGVHENDLPQNVWLDITNNPFVDLITYEDILVLERRNFTQAVAHATGFTEDNYIGLELDLDVFGPTGTGMPPTGIGPLQARQYVTFAATDSRIAYFHICEGVYSICHGQSEAAGLLMATIVSDFLKARE